MDNLYSFDKKQNNFDIIRLIAAIGVVFSHSYDLADKSHLEPLRRLTTYSFSYYGVRIFFIISCYLIVKGLFSSPACFLYFYKRVLRIFPGLVVVVLFSVFALGPFATTLPIATYFQRPETYTYFSNIVLYHSQPSLPGVFQTINHSAYINGSLWTLTYEFTFYVGLYFAFNTGFLNKRLCILIFVLLLIMLDLCLQNQALLNSYYPSINMAVGPFIEFSIFFLTGIIFHLYEKEIVITKTNGYLASAIIGIALIVLPPWASKIINYTVLPYALFFFSFMKGETNNFGQYGDYSYGFYIYSYPIQNLIFHYFPDFATWQFLTVSLICIIPFAFFSWTFVEAPMIRFKRPIEPKNLPGLFDKPKQMAN
jgi:peptidoglycan/LPS O-acetylase OafA/YrhL